VRCRFPASRLGAPLCDVCVILFCFSFSAAVFSRRPVCLSVFEALLSLLSQLLLTLYRLNYVFSLLNEKKEPTHGGLRSPPQLVPFLNRKAPLGSCRFWI
jgi:hypothetical protein